MKIISAFLLCFLFLAGCITQEDDDFEKKIDEKLAVIQKEKEEVIPSVEKNLTISGEKVPNVTTTVLPNATANRTLAANLTKNTTQNKTEMKQLPNVIYWRDSLSFKPEGEACDSDEGYYPYEKGSVGRSEEYCVDSDTLAEYVCYDDLNYWRAFSHFCPNGCSNGECRPDNYKAEPGDCKEVSLNSNRRDQERINLVFIGFNYGSLEEFKYLVNKSLGYDSRERGVFSIEPYKSNRNKFNVWYMDKLFQIELDGVENTELYGSSLSEELRNRIFFSGNKISSACGTRKTVPVILVKGYGISLANFPSRESEAFTGILSNAIIYYPDSEVISAFPDCTDDYTCGFLSDFYINKSTPIIVTHELGHAIGNLEDEYDIQFLPSNISRGIYNCYPDDTLSLNKQTCMQRAPWSDLIGYGCGDKGVVDCSENNPDYEMEVSCFRGCSYSFDKSFRPAYSTIMGVANTNLTWFNDSTKTRVYGPVNERLLCCHLLYYTGSVSGVCNDYNTGHLNLVEYCSGIFEKETEAERQKAT